MKTVKAITARITGQRDKQQGAVYNYADNYYGDQVRVLSNAGK